MLYDILSCLQGLRPEWQPLLAAASTEGEGDHRHYGHPSPCFEWRGWRGHGHVPQLTWSTRVLTCSVCSARYSAYSWGLRDGLRPGRSLGEGDSSQHLRWTCRSVQSCMSWKPGLVEASSSIRNHAQKCPAGLLGSSRCPWASFWEDQMPGVRPRSMQFLPVSAEWLPTFLRQGSCDAEPLPGPEPHDFPAADFIPILGDFVCYTAQAPEALPEYGCCCLEARRRPQPWSILCRDCQALGWTHFRRRRECSEHICEQGAVESGGASCPEVRWEWQCYDLWYPISDINCIWSWEQMNNHE